MMNQKQPKVLIVDPDETQHRGLAVALEPFGLEIHATVNPFEAIHLLKETSFDIILTEFHFPTMDSRNIIERFRKTSQEAEMIVMSVYNENEIHEATPDSQSIHYIKKPIDVAVLNQKISILTNMRQK